MIDPLPALGAPWRTRPAHRVWLLEQANRLFDLFQRNSVNPEGGFFELDGGGAPMGSLRQIHSTTRMVHCFCIAHLLGRPGADDIVDHGLRYIRDQHRDSRHGGYMWSLDGDGPRDSSKQAYGHAFVLLAASGAKVVGHPYADELIADITEALNTRFWEERHGAVREEFARDWSGATAYRGQNSNMHLTEALMAAFEATGERAYLAKALRIAQLIIGKHAAALDYCVPEHFDEAWSIDRDYKGSDMFRPSGTTPGHWLEWSRLLLQLWELGGRAQSWLPDAAQKLFRSAVSRGWDPATGGFYYTMNFDNTPRLTHKIWWPVTEAIGAAAYLSANDPDPFYEAWYRRLWGFAANHLIDPANGGWFPELGGDLKPIEKFFKGKPDIYHALQACLIPLYPATGSLTRVIGAAA